VLAELPDATTALVKVVLWGQPDTPDPPTHYKRILAAVKRVRAEGTAGAAAPQVEEAPVPGAVDRAARKADRRARFTTLVAEKTAPEPEVAKKARRAR
jgi:hypothetical protein